MNHGNVIAVVRDFQAGVLGNTLCKSSPFPAVHILHSLFRSRSLATVYCRPIHEAFYPGTSSVDIAACHGCFPGSFRSDKRTNVRVTMMDFLPLTVRIFSADTSLFDTDSMRRQGTFSGPSRWCF